MRPSNALTAERLLHVLLDRFEQPKQRTRDITEPIDYTRVGDPSAQDEFHRVLLDAERAGAINLEQERLGRFTGEFARVRLIDAERLYRFLVREPVGAIADRARQAIEASLPDILGETFFRSLAEEAAGAWQGGKSFLGFAPAEVEKLAIVLRLAHGVMSLAGRDVDHRTFSRRVVKDSKALERWEARVAQILKRCDVSLKEEEPRDVLEAFGIVHRAHLLQVKGPLLLRSDGFLVKGTSEVFIGLPWTSVQHATLSKPIDYIITIENSTSFWRFCTEVSGDYLALSSDGFPARDVLSSMVHLVKAARELSDAPVYHWGDIDAGGVRIAAHLEDAFGTSVLLHQMEPALASALGTRLQSRKGLDRLAVRAGDVGELARWLLCEDAKALEQEELDPRAPLIPER